MFMNTLFSQVLSYSLNILTLVYLFYQVGRATFGIITFEEATIIGIVVLVVLSIIDYHIRGLCIAKRVIDNIRERL